MRVFFQLSPTLSRGYLTTLNKAPQLTEDSPDCCFNATSDSLAADLKVFKSIFTYKLIGGDDRN